MKYSLNDEMLLRSCFLRYRANLSRICHAYVILALFFRAFVRDNHSPLYFCLLIIKSNTGTAFASENNEYIRIFTLIIMYGLFFRTGVFNETFSFNSR